MPASTESPAARPPRRVLLVDVDSALIELIETWLAAEGYAVLHASTAPDSAPVDQVDLAIVEVPFPRQAGVDCARRVGERHPGVPILALSSTFFAGVECNGPVARALGVACVLPKPVPRDALIRAVHRLMPITPDVVHGPLDVSRRHRPIDG